MAIHKKTKECIGKTYNRLTILEIDHVNEKQHVIVKIRCICGTEKLLNASAVRSGKVKSCGCLPRDNGRISAPLITKHARKESCSNWKGGVTTENELQRKSAAYKDWRLEVFARDNFTCQKCYKKRGKLEAHHLFNFADYPELRFDRENGKTLCFDCHKSFHIIFGYKNSTNIHQMYAFLNQ